MLPVVSNTHFCPLLNKEIEDGYCWELSNLGTDDVLIDGDIIEDWDKAYSICDKCEWYC